MGSALAILHDRAGAHVHVLGTRYDDAAVEAIRTNKPHPALGITLASRIDARPAGAWAAVLRNTQRVVLGVSSDGLADMVAEVAPLAHPRAVWAVATKGWDPETLRTPSEVLSENGVGPDRIVILAGPALAPEIVAGAPTAMVAASRNVEAAEEVAASLRDGGVSAAVTDDVVGAETAAAYKNVTAIAVGMCEGLSERLPERVFVHRFANARSAVFAQGLRDMTALATARGGRLETILGLAGAGDLYVTCLGGRNGNFGRLLGEGQSPQQAERTIGSTVEGVANTAAALGVAERHGVELHAARCVNAVLSGQATPEDAVKTMVASIQA